MVIGYKITKLNEAQKMLNKKDIIFYGARLVIVYEWFNRER